MLFIIFVRNLHMYLLNWLATFHSGWRTDVELVGLSPAREPEDHVDWSGAVEGQTGV